MEELRPGLLFRALEIGAFEASLQWHCESNLFIFYWLARMRLTAAAAARKRGLVPPQAETYRLRLPYRRQNMYGTIPHLAPLPAPSLWNPHHRTRGQFHSLVVVKSLRQCRKRATVTFLGPVCVDARMSHHPDRFRSHRLTQFGACGTLEPTSPPFFSAARPGRMHSAKVPHRLPERDPEPAIR